MSSIWDISAFTIPLTTESWWISNLPLHREDLHEVRICGTVHGANPHKMQLGSVSGFRRITFPGTGRVLKVEPIEKLNRFAGVTHIVFQE